MSDASGLQAFEDALADAFTDWRQRGRPWRPLREAWMRAEARARAATAGVVPGPDENDLLTAEAMPPELWAMFYAQDLNLNEAREMKRARERHRRRRKLARNVAPSVPNPPGAA